MDYDRMIKIYIAAILDSGIDHLKSPPTDEDKEEYARQKSG